MVFYCTNPTASVQDIVEAFADRATIEQAPQYVKAARREGGVGVGTTTGAQHLDESRRVQFKFLDATTYRTLGVGQKR